MTTATLKNARYDVWLEQPDHADADDDGIRHVEVVIRNGDQLRAELEANKLRLPRLTEAPLHATSLWVWAVCARTGETQSPAAEFIHKELVNYQPAGDVDVDPTGLPPS
jgi:hypothetical protein